MEKTRFRLNICGVEVLVSGNADEAAAREIAEAVRSRMQRILNTAYAASVEKAAVITAMNLCEELEAERARTAALEAELKAAKEAAKEVPVQTVLFKPVQKKPLRNPLRPDMGDQTGLVSFFAKEGMADKDEEETD